MRAGKLTIRDLVLCAMFTVLIAAGALIRIPVPVVPFTLQFLFTTLAGLLLGGRLGLISVCLYIALGLVGLPVFASGGGPAYIFQPSFGYLLGFAAGAWATGRVANRRAEISRGRLLAACFVGLAVVYAFGMAYCWAISKFYLGTDIGLWPLFLYCFVLAAPGDVALCFLSAELAWRMFHAKRVGEGIRT